ncbi:MAG: DUF2871 domain-containing protein [Bulleidia sp.]
MKKYLNTAMAYAVGALCGGVFYREFTKWNGYTGVTALSRVHVHLFVLGVLVNLIIALSLSQLDIEHTGTWKPCMITYNAGLIVTVIMFVVRGVLQVTVQNPSSVLSASVSGIAGIGHILLGIGIILLIRSYRIAAKES